VTSCLGSRARAARNTHDAVCARAPGADKYGEVVEQLQAVQAAAEASHSEGTDDEVRQRLGSATGRVRHLEAELAKLQVSSTWHPEKQAGLLLAPV
jgi:hypothetical protein